MSRWIGHFGLRETPFTKDIGAADLWVPKSRGPVIERLVEACRERRARALAEGHRGRGLLHDQLAHHRTRPRERTSRAPDRRGPPPAPGRPASPAHPRQLRVGLQTPAPARARRPAGDPTAPHAREESLALLAGTHTHIARRGNGDGHRGVRRIPHEAGGCRTRGLQRRRHLDHPRARAGAPTGHRPHLHRRA